MANASFVAVLDIGKTNKKVMIFNERLELVDKAYRQFPTHTWEGLPVEDTKAMLTWFEEELTAFAKKFPISAISITTHGATFACLDDQGKLVFPVIDYTFEPGDNFQKNFFKDYGDDRDLQQQTATAHFGGLINPAKALHLLKTRHPGDFARVKHLLFYPQFIGHHLTGKAGTEPTYIGCHSYLWDFQTQTPSSVAKKMGVAGMIPLPLQKSWDVLGTLRHDLAARLGLSAQTPVTLGIHDSNSSLLPYLVKNTGSFTLNSTGTWCVAMRPDPRVAFAPDELGKVVFYNLDAWQRPVKTGIFLGGLEFESWSGLMKKRFGERPWPQYDEHLVKKLLSDRSLFLLPGLVPGTGQFPLSKPRWVEAGASTSFEDIASGKATPSGWRNFETCYAVLNLSLAIQTAVALDRVGAAASQTLFTEGGFRKNDFYNKLLTSLFPGKSLALTNLEEATAFGAAMLGLCALEKITPDALAPRFTIETQAVLPVNLPDMPAYRTAWSNLL